MTDHLPTWAALEGRRLRGVMDDSDDHEDAWLFFDEDALRISTINKDYSWHDNWGIVEQVDPDDWPDRDDSYKIIGEEILTVTSEFYDTDQLRITADMETWIDDVGHGSWNAKPGVQHTLVELLCGMKHVEFGTVYIDCHYPNAVWDVIADA